MPERLVLMPKLGLTMTEGVIVEWKVAPGDRIDAGKVIFVVETDKITNDIEAAESGVVSRLHARVGEIVPVGEVVATLAEDDAPGMENARRAPTAEFAKDAARTASASKVLQLSQSTESKRVARSVATPYARRLAARAGLPVDSIGGSGPRGRIIAADVSAAIASWHEVGGPARVQVQGARRRPLTAHQRVIARRLSEAKRDMPHFYAFVEADITSLLELRSKLNERADRRRLTLTPFVVTALARALATVPGSNIAWGDDNLLEFEQVDVGVAIETAKGLVAPVLRNISSCSVDEVAEAAAATIDRARAGRLSRADLAGGASCVSNVGMFGAMGLLPIINPGQSSILGVGASQAVFRPDAHQRPALRQVLHLSISCDHRAINGEIAARLLKNVRDALETPSLFLAGQDGV